MTVLLGILLPSAVILSGKSIKHISPFSAKTNIILASAAAAFAILQQLVGVYSLNTVAKECRLLENTIRKTQIAVVASDVFYLPEMTPRIWFENVTADISKKENIQKLLELKPEEILLVLSTSPQFRRISDENLNLLLKNYTIEKTQLFKTPRGTGFIDLVLAKLTLKDNK